MAEKLVLVPYEVCTAKKPVFYSLSPPKISGNPFCCERAEIFKEDIEMKSKKSLVLAMVALFTLALSATPGRGVNFTLSDGALMSLDWYNRNNYYPPPTATVLERRNTRGPGVEFDIHYPGNQAPDSSLECVSSKYGGAGTLVGIDISTYDNFELKFTLLSVNGIVPPPSAELYLIVGSIIDIDSTWGFRPEVIGFAPDKPTTAISSTSTDVERIGMVGFTAYIPYWWPTNNWDPSGSTVTLRVELLPAAVAIPEPATVWLLTLGGLALLRKHRT